MARFMLMIVGDGKDVAELDEVGMKEHLDEYWAYDDALERIGALVDAAPLVDVAQATTVAPGGVTTDGPFVESAEHVGGYYLIDVPDHETAVDWAHKVPGVLRGFNRVEVRAVLEMTR